MKTIRVRITFLTGLTIFIVSILLALTSISVANRSIDESSIVTANVVFDLYNYADDSSNDQAIALFKAADVEEDQQLGDSTNLQESESISPNESSNIQEDDTTVALDTIENEKGANLDNSQYERLYEIQAIINKFSIIQIFAVLLATFLGSLLTYFFVGKALEPLNTLSKEMKYMSHSNLGSELDLDSEYEEIISLRDSFNTMNLRLKEQFGRQKRFSSNAAHELKTPIAVMKTATQILDEESDLIDYQESNAIIEKNINKLDLIVTDLLDFANEEEVIKNSMVNISELLTIIEAEFESYAKDNNVKFINDLDDTIIITCNRTLVTRVFTNLISNAIKYNKFDGKVYVTLTKEHDKFFISIADTGIGIEACHLVDIFDPFYRVDKHYAIGSGLGLSIVKKGIDLLGWKIEVSSVVNEKTIFTITI